MTPSPRALRLVACACLCAAGCRTRDPEQAQAPAGRASATAPAPGTSVVLATGPDDESPPTWVSSSRSQLHARSPGAEREFFFAERGGGVAYVLEKGDELQVIHNDRAGGPYAAVGDVVLSRDGRRCAYGALSGGKWRMVADGQEGKPFSAIRMPVFSPDGAHLAYQAMAGDRWYLVVDGKVNRGTRTRYTQHAFSGDSSRIAWVEDVDDAELGRLVISDLAFENPVVVASRVSRVVVNRDGTRVATIATVEGRQRVVASRFERPGSAAAGPLHDAVSDLSFGPDGVALAYAAEDSGRRLVALDDRAEPLAPGDGAVGPPVARPGNRGLGVLVASGGSILLRQFPPDAAPDGGGYEEAEALVYSADGRSHAYAARRGDRWFVVVNGKEGPPFDRVVTPLFSPDGKLVVYRARQDARRFVVVADTSGRTTRQHPPYEQVFPVVFTADGRSAAYGVKDGRQLAWKVEAL